jgi:hypothetical protein
VVERGGSPPRDATTRIKIAIPCGKCIGCRMSKAQDWAVRCLHEKKMWPESCFVTLTYADEWLPSGGSLVLRDLQLFMKRLRFKRKASASNPIRYFIGGEYGEQNGRPHYHALLFNCGFRDMVRIGVNARGESLFTSAELSSLWSVDGVPMGYCTIGEVTFESALYCAKYALKKITGDRAYDYYQVYDENGVVFNRSPEFAIQSKRPGLGGFFFDKFFDEIMNNDSVIVGGREVRVPRYYTERSKSRLEHSDVSVLCKCLECCNKRLRKRRAVANAADNTDERLRVKERLMQIAAKEKEKKL